MEYFELMELTVVFVGEEPHESAPSNEIIACQDKACMECAKFEQPWMYWR